MQKVNYPQSGSILHREHLTKEQELIQSNLQNRFIDISTKWGVIDGGIVSYNPTSNKLDITETIAYDKQGNRIYFVATEQNIDSGQYKLIVRHKFITKTEENISYLANSYELLNRTGDLLTGDILLANINATDANNIVVTDKRYRIDHTPPIGSIMPFNPGYFSEASNATFTLIGPTANTIVAINQYLPSNWRVCDGTAPNDPESPIFNTPTKYLPNLTDSRFLMGDSTSGTQNGKNDIVLPGHYHSRGSLYVSSAGSHTHSYTDKYNVDSSLEWDDGNRYRSTPYYISTVSRSTGSAGSHNHSIYGTIGNTSSEHNGDNNTTLTNENIPRHLTCFYIIRIK